MAVIAWKEVYATGIVALDNEHKALIEEINRLYEAVRNKKGEEVLGDILLMLTSYTLDHFAHEEKLMAQYGYPGLQEHQAIHQQLREAVQEMKARASHGNEPLAAELLKYLRFWLLEHIVEVDKKYGAFLESRGGRFLS